MFGWPSTLQSETSRPPTLVSASKNSTVTEGDGAAQIARAAGAVHASHTTGADRREIGELLLAAGAEIEPRFLDAAEGPLLELLEERLAA